MEELLQPEFLRRLLVLRERLRRARRGERAFREGPTGRGASPEVESHREYAPGDDVRHIDWNLYARLDRFFVKSVVKEEEGLLHVLVDTSASMVRPRPEKLQRAAELAAAFSYLALGSGQRVALGAWADGLHQLGEPLLGEGQTLTALKFLARLRRGAGTDLDRTLGGVLRLRTVPSSAVVILSDFIDAGAWGRRVEELLAADATVGAVQVLHPDEIRPPNLRGPLRIEDAETGGTVEALVGHEGMLRVRRAVAEFLEGTERFFRRRAARFVRADATRPFEDAAFEYFAPAREGA